MTTLAELKSECKRAEKVIKENKSRPKAVHELEFTEGEIEKKVGHREVEAINRPQFSKSQQAVSVHGKVSQSINPDVKGPRSIRFVRLRST